MIMKILKLKVALTLFLSVIVMLGIGLQAREMSEAEMLKHLIERGYNPVEESIPSEKIYYTEGALFCTGSSEAAVANNLAAELMLKGNYEDALKKLRSSITRAPLFYPFRYNAGKSCIHLYLYPESVMHLQKAVLLVPEYWRTYIELGDLYARMGSENYAIDSFRKAVSLNRKDMSAIIRIGDIFFNRNQLEVASKYYESVLELNPRHPDGLLGKAKIMYRREKYLKALNTIKAIKEKGQYDRSLHFYHAECLYKLKEYSGAADQYEKLLSFPGDRFFLTTAVSLIRHKLDMSRRLSSVEQ